MAHITPQQRYTISCMLKNGYTKIEIAKAIDKDKTVVYRELKRNSDARSGIYKDELANRKYAKRQKEKHKYKRFTASIKQDIEKLLREDYSPEQVVGTLKK